MPPEPLRIGVTGSRFFASPLVIRKAFEDAHDRARPHSGHVLVHGQCNPRHPDTGRLIPWAYAKKMSWEVQGRYQGGDWLAEWVALDMRAEMEWEFDRHPADWEAPCRPECKPGHRRNYSHRPEFCPAAGNYRNDEMTALGADGWIALYKRGAANTGTSDGIRRATAAGIKVWKYTA